MMNEGKTISHSFSLPMKYYENGNIEWNLIGLRRDNKSQNKTDCFSSDNYQSIKELKIYWRKYVLEMKQKLSEYS